jgi:hypothetical protein
LESIRFKIGDKVRCVRGVFLSDVGSKAIGVIAGKRKGYGIYMEYIVDYSNDLKNVNCQNYLHTCGGKLRKATGYYIYKSDLELVSSKTTNIDKY